MITIACGIGENVSPNDHLLRLREHCLQIPQSLHHGQLCICTSLEIIRVAASDCRSFANPMGLLKLKHLARKGNKLKLRQSNR